MICMGDVHGQLETVVRVLRGGGLIDGAGKWSGGRKQLFFLGDFANRGPDGIGAIELVMRLEKEAREAGGQVRALLGNHDVLILSAYHLGDREAGGPGGTFFQDFVLNGGLAEEVKRLTPALIEWLTSLPAMVHEGDVLLQHADSLLYAEYGNTVQTVNEAFAAVLVGRDPVAWDRMLERFSDRLAFWNEPECAVGYLAAYGGRRLIHGHTPIPYMTTAEPESVAAPLVYAEGRCINVDGGLYMGGPGFLFAEQE